MKTDYDNLNSFEAATVAMIFVGLLLVGFQFYTALPAETKSQIVAASSMLDMHEIYEDQVKINKLVVGGVQDFYGELYLALGEVLKPVADDTVNIARAYMNTAEEFEKGFVVMSEIIAANYYNNINQPGVEAGMGGKILGAYIERAAELVPVPNW